MKTKKIMMTVLLCLLSFTLIVGCGQGSQNSSGSEGSQNQSSGSNSNASTGSNSGGQVKQMRIATATSTGAWYPIGGVMASIFGEHIEGYNFTAEPSSGSIENSRNVHSKQVPIAMGQANVLYEAYNGVATFEADGKLDMAGFGALYNTPIQIVTLEKSGIKTIRDLEGKKVAVGAPGSGTNMKTVMFLEAYGIEEGKNITFEYLDYGDATNALVDGIIDVAIVEIGIPSAVTQELATTHDITLIPFDREGLDKLYEKHPYFSDFTIPANIYNGVTEDILTFGTMPNIIVHPDLDEELVYQMAKALFGTDYEKFVQGHAAMQYHNLEDTPYTIVPLHPGAERYYKEAGLLD